MEAAVKQAHEKLSANYCMRVAQMQLPTVHSTDLAMALVATCSTQGESSPAILNIPGIINRRP